MEEKNSRKHIKSLALVLAAVLLFGGVIGGTIAWLIAKTDTVTNKFTTSDISVTLEETTETYKMIPGWTIEKDPKVTVSADSEDCYLFIHVLEEGGNVTVDGKTYRFSDFIAYAIADGWTQLSTDNVTTHVVGSVYYMEIDKEDEKGVAYSILGAGEYTDESGTEYTWKVDEVLTKPEVTKEMMAAVTTSNQPKLSFTAYASQLMKNNTERFTPGEAFNNLLAAVVGFENPEFGAADGEETNVLENEDGVP